VHEKPTHRVGCFFVAFFGTESAEPPKLWCELERG
jgi:hypothetical protein